MLRYAAGEKPYAAWRSAKAQNDTPMRDAHRYVFKVLQRYARSARAAKQTR